MGITITYSGRKRNLYTSKTKEKNYGQTGYKVSYSFVLAIGGQSLVLRVCSVHTIELQCIGVPTCIIHAACENKLRNEVTHLILDYFLYFSDF